MALLCETRCPMGLGGHSSFSCRWQHDSHESRTAGSHALPMGVCSAHLLRMAPWPQRQLAGLEEGLFRHHLESSFSARAITLSGCQG